MTYYGLDLERSFEIWVDGERFAIEQRAGPARSDWVEIDYPLPPTSAGKSMIEFRAIEGSAVVYGVRIVQPPRLRL